MESAQVHELAAVRKRAPQKIVTTLEGLLLQAAEGKIAALAVVLIDDVGEVHTAHVAQHDEQLDRLSAGAFRLMRRIDDERP